MSGIGSRNGNARLTEDDVVLIRKLADERAALAAKIAECQRGIVEARRDRQRISNRQLAEKFGVHHRVIESVIYGSAWAHIP